jgi:hypothetical protein
MRRVKAIFLILLLLNSYIDLYEFSKMHNLFLHYLEHNSKTQISLLDYIMLHYFSGNEIDEDFKKDQQLPFKSDQTCVQANSIQIYFQEIYLSIIDLTYHIVSIKKYNSIVKNIALKDISIKVWQPPKIV